jgi:hypothetical protein
MAVVREICTLSILGEKVTLELSAPARAHLEARVHLLGDPKACLSHLVTTLVVAASFPEHPRRAAEKARMPFARWVAAVALSATGYSELGSHIARATAALEHSAP